MHPKRILVLVLATIFNIEAYGQDLGRWAEWQAKVQGPSKLPGATIESIEKDSPLRAAGLEAGDIILKVNGRLIDSDEVWTDIQYGIRANQVLRLQVKRQSESRNYSIRLKGKAKEKHAGLDTYYEAFTNNYGIRQRVIITKPTNANTKLPAVLMIGGLSCSSMELYPGRSSNWARVINDVVEDTDMVVMRIEKPGVGDSEGDCAETDFYTELDGIREAAKLLKSKDYVDTTRIVVYGSSMGSALAPVIANEFNFAGVVSDGTFFKTWYEHMLEIERRIRQMQGDSESEIAKKMNQFYIPLYHGMLIEKRTYQEVVDQYPAIASHNYHGARHMYGRPTEYYKQLQDFDFAGAWEKIKVPVRIMRGTNDWIMSEFDNKMIIEVLDRNGHEDHALYQYPGLDHWNTIHEKPADSFFGKEGKWEDEISGKIVRWLREMAGS